MAEPSLQDQLKKAVGYEAVDRYVKSGMTVGLGTGTTAYFVVMRICEKLKNGELKDIKAVPTSERTKQIASTGGIDTCNLEDVGGVLDICIDGADEIEEITLNIIKGRGGALLREKMVAASAKNFIVVVDESKKIERKKMGLTGALPVEVVKFSCLNTQRRIMNLPQVSPFCAFSTFRKKDATPSSLLSPPQKTPSSLCFDLEELFISDNANYIIDLYFDKPIDDIRELDKQLKSIVGVVETGLFLSMGDIALVSKQDGSIQEMTVS